MMSGLEGHLRRLGEFAPMHRGQVRHVEGMQLRTDVDDAILQTFFDYLRTLRGHTAP